MTFYDPQNAYLYHTDKYKLPYGRVYTVGNVSGVGPLSEAEYHKFNVIDFQMRGAARAYGNGAYYVSGVVIEGNYGQSITDQQAVVQLDSFQGILNDNAIGRGSIGWSGLDISRDQFLFVGLISENTDLGNRKSSSAFNDLVAFAQDGPAVPNDNSMLLAIRRSGLLLNVDSDISSRVDLNLIDHIESPNPHGNTWEQNQLVVSGLNVQTQLTVNNDVTVRSGLSLSESAVVEAVGGLSFQSAKIENDLYVYGGSILADAAFAQVSGTTLQANVIALQLNDFAAPYNSGTDVGFQAAPHTSGVEVTIVNFGKLATSGSIILVGNQQTIDDVRPSINGALEDQHLADFNNPHNLTPVRVSGLSRLGVGDPNQYNVSPFNPPRNSPYWGLQGNWPLADGVLIDGVDPSDLKPLIGGHSGIDNLHTHDLLPPDGIFVGYAPEYPGLCVSGLSPGTFETSRFSGHNWYDWYSYKEDDVIVYSRMKVPAGVSRIGYIELNAYSQPFSKGLARLQFSVFDTDAVKLSSISPAWIEPPEVPTTYRFSGGGLGSNLGGTFEENKEFDFMFRMRSASGLGVHLGSFNMWWY